MGKSQGNVAAPTYYANLVCLLNLDGLIVKLFHDFKDKIRAIKNLYAFKVLIL